MAIPYALKVLETRCAISPPATVCCVSRWALRLVALKSGRAARPETSTGAGLAFACVLSIGDFGVVALFGTMISVPCRFISTSKLAPIAAGRCGHRVNSATTLFSAVYRDEKLPGRNVKTD